MGLSLFLGKKRNFKVKINLADKDLNKSKQLINLLLKMIQKHPTIKMVNAKPNPRKSYDHNSHMKLIERLGKHRPSHNGDEISQLIKNNNQTEVSKNLINQINNVTKKINSYVSGYENDLADQWKNDPGGFYGDKALGINLGYGTLMAVREQLRKKFHIKKTGDAVTDDLQYHWSWSDGFDSIIWKFMLTPDCDGGPFSPKECKHLYAIFKTINLKNKDLNKDLQSLTKGFKIASKENRPLFWC